MKSQNYISKLENLINSSYSNHLNPLINSNNDIYQQKKLQNSNSNPRISIKKSSNITISTSNKKEDFLNKSMNLNINSTSNSKNTKRINYVSPHSKSISILKKMIEENPKRIKKTGLINPYNKPNKFNVGNANQEDIQHQIEDFTKELKKKNNGLSYINKPISSFYNFNFNNYNSPLHSNRLKNLINAENVSRIFNNSNLDFFKSNKKKFGVYNNKKKNIKYYFVPENKKYNSEKVIDDFMREFNENKIKALFQNNNLRKSQSTHNLNLNF